MGRRRTRPPALRARDVMSAPVLAVDVEATTRAAWSRLLESGRRHLVVCDGTRCVGVVDDRALFAQWPSGPYGVHTVPVRRLIRARTTCVLPDTSLRRVARVMVDDGVDAVPVTDEHGDLLGIVTGSDIAAAVADREL